MYKNLKTPSTLIRLAIYIHIIFNLLISYYKNTNLMVENLYFFIYLNTNYDFLQDIEKLIILSVFNRYNTKEALIIKYHNIYDIGYLSFVHNISIYDINIKQIYTTIAKDLDHGTVFYSILMTTICLTIQLIIKNHNKNLKRKVFHIFLMLYFWNYNETKRILTIYLLTLLIYFNDTSILRSFLWKDENQNIILPHIILLASFFYTSKLVKYKMFIITMCILDTCASIPGTLMNSTTKTIYGTIFGAFCAISVHYFMFRNVKLFYYVLCAIVEYYCDFNDNLALPYFSLMVLK